MHTSNMRKWMIVIIKKARGIKLSDNEKNTRLSIDDLKACRANKMRAVK